MIPIRIPTSAVQKGTFSLAGMLRVVKVFSPSALVRMYTNVNVFSLPKITDIATNIDARNLSKPVIHLAKNSAEWLSKVVIETASAGVSLPVRECKTSAQAAITSLNEAHLTVIRVPNEPRLGVIAPTHQLTISKMASSIRPQHLKSYGYDADFQNVRTIKKECAGHLESVKKNLPIFRFTVYGNSASAKSDVGIGVLECLSAIHDAPSVFFCVVRIAQPFFGSTVIIRAAYQVMVGCSGAEKSAPVSDNAGYANPVQSITSEIGVSGDGIYTQLSEAAIWLLPLPQKYLLSGLLALFAVIARKSPHKSIISKLNQSTKLAARLPVNTLRSLLGVFARGPLMLNQFTVLGYGTNQRGLTIGINYKITSDSTAKATAHAMLQAQRDGLTRIRITRVMGATA